MSLFQKIVRLFQSKPTPINDNTRIRVELLFTPNEQAQVITTLESQCGYNLPGISKSTPELLDQVRFSVLKVSDGNLTELLSAVKVAINDWRDIIIKADFGYDTSGYRGWMPEKKWQ